MKLLPHHIFIQWWIKNSENFDSQIYNINPLLGEIFNLFRERI